MTAPGRAEAGQFVIEAGDPCLDGHFSGAPVVPGVVLLDRALALAKVETAAIPKLRFPSPVLPGESVTVAVDRHEARVDLGCRVGERVVLEARCEIVS